MAALGPRKMIIVQHNFLRAFGIPVRVYTHEVVTLWYRCDILKPKASMIVLVFSFDCILQGPRSAAWLPQVLLSTGHLVSRHHICRDGHKEATFPGDAQLFEYLTVHNFEIVA